MEYVEEELTEFEKFVEYYDKVIKRAELYLELKGVHNGGISIEEAYDGGITIQVEEYGCSGCRSNYQHYDIKAYVFEDEDWEKKVLEQIRYTKKVAAKKAAAAKVKDAEQREKRELAQLAKLQAKYESR